MKKQGILKELKENKGNVITHPDKGNGIVLINRKDYSKAMRNIIEDNSKFKKLKSRPYLIKRRTITMFY